MQSVFVAADVTAAELVVMGLLKLAFHPVSAPALWLELFDFGAMAAFVLVIFLAEKAEMKPFEKLVLMLMYLPEKGKEKQLNVVKKLMNDEEVFTVINACDAGREGELIFRLVYECCGCTKPMARLWIHSMEDKAILDGFNHLRPGSDFDNLYHAALCRSEADWLIGINATRKYGLLAHRRGMTIGRVQSPTLVMLTERAKEIDEFEPVPYYNLHLSVNGVEAVREKIFDLSEADALAEKCSGKSVTVKKVEKKEKNVHPPKLCDLTTLQREANRHCWSA